MGRSLARILLTRFGKRRGSVSVSYYQLAPMLDAEIRRYMLAERS